MKKSPMAIDSSCLIAIQANEPLKKEFQQLLKTKWKGYCTEMALLETFYILCRKTNWEKSRSKVEALIESNVLQIRSIKSLLKKAAQIKCQSPVAIADCLNIALAESIQGKAIFYHKEIELEKALEKGPFNVEVIFFDEFLKKE